MKSDQDRSGSEVLLKGSLLLNEGSVTTPIVATVNLVIEKYSISGARIEKVLANSGCSESKEALQNMKDDQAIGKVTRQITVVKDFEYRF